eukprot:g433.t1
MYNSTYTSHHPKYQECSYQEAVKRAKRESKFLLVYLHSPEHSNTLPFCMSIFSDPNLREFIDNNMLVWGGSVHYPDGCRAAQSMGVTTYPSLVMILSTTSRGAAMADRIAGAKYKSPELLLQRLTATLTRQSGALDRARQEERARNFERSLRVEQDREYNLSLARDRKKQEERLKKQIEDEAKEEKQMEEEAVSLSKKLAAQKLIEEKKKRVGEARKNGDVEIVFRLPCGKRLRRSFHHDDTFRLLRDFLEIQEDMKDISNYSLNANFPKKEWSIENTPDEKTFSEAQLKDGTAVFIRNLDA